MCSKHDPIYQTENESNGGTGCPRCNRERSEVKPGWSVNPVVTLMQPETIALVEMTRIIFEQAEPIEY